MPWLTVTPRVDRKRDVLLYPRRSPEAPSPIYIRGRLFLYRVERPLWNNYLPTLRQLLSYGKKIIFLQTFTTFNYVKLILLWVFYSKSVKHKIIIRIYHKSFCEQSNWSPWQHRYFLSIKTIFQFVIFYKIAQLLSTIKIKSDILNGRNQPFLSNPSKIPGWFVPVSVSKTGNINKLYWGKAKMVISP